jgi:hypothetical protein
MVMTYGTAADCLLVNSSSNRLRLGVLVNGGMLLVLNREFYLLLLAGEKYEEKIVQLG